MLKSEFFRNSSGEVVITQPPNIPIVIWFITLALSRFTDGKTAEILSWISFGALIIWSLLEIFKGDSQFRKILGAVVLMALVMRLTKAVV